MRITMVIHTILLNWGSNTPAQHTCTKPSYRLYQRWGHTYIYILHWVMTWTGNPLHGDGLGTLEGGVGIEWASEI